MRKTYTKESKWGTQDGKWIKIKDLDDIHLANIIKHLETYGYNEEMRTTMIQEAKDRKLKQEFLDRALIPFKNENGDWMLWSHSKRKSIKVG